MNKRLANIKKYFKKISELKDEFNYERMSEEEEKIANKLLSKVPEESVLSIICNILKNNENLKNQIYNKIYKGDAELDELA